MKRYTSNGERNLSGFPSKPYLQVETPRRKIDKEDNCSGCRCVAANMVFRRVFAIPNGKGVFDCGIVDNELRVTGEQLLASNKSASHGITIICPTSPIANFFTWLPMVPPDPSLSSSGGGLNVKDLTTDDQRRGRTRPEGRSQRFLDSAALRSE